MSRPRLSGSLLLIFFPSLSRGGCEEYALYVAAKSKAEGLQVCACFPHVPFTEGIREELRSHGVVAHDWQASRTRTDAPWGSFDDQYREAQVILESLQPDRVWMIMPWVDAAPGFLAACADLRLRGLCVWQLASQTVEMRTEEAMRARQSIKSGVAWVSVSRDNRPHLARSYGVREDEIHVIHNGLLPRARDSTDEQIVSRPLARSSVRTELGLAANARLIITVARLCLEQKAHDVLLKAIDRLRSAEDLHFVWVGTGEDELALRRQVDALALSRRLTFLGYRSDVRRLLSASDAFVLPSHFEGMPFSVIEALACGCPVVATRVGDLADILVDGLHAMLVQPGDAGSIARAIDAVVRDRDLAGRLTSNGSAIAQQLTGDAMFSKSFALLQAH